MKRFQKLWSSIGFISVFGLAVPMLVACASGPSTASEMSPEREATIHHACADIMGLRPGQSDYQMCSLSLQQTAASIDAGHDVDRHRQACAGKGLAPDTKEFAVCVVDAENASAQR
jgi:hypothetical protein